MIAFLERTEVLISFAGLIAFGISMYLLLVYRVKQLEGQYASLIKPDIDELKVALRELAEVLRHGQEQTQCRLSKLETKVSGIEVRCLERQRRHRKGDDE